MILEPNMYVPSLRCRAGELRALSVLSESAKQRTVPLLTIPPIEYDFDVGALAKSVHEHMIKMPGKIQRHWPDRECWLDVDPSLRDGRMDDGRNAVEYLFDTIRSLFPRATPVVTPDLPAKLFAVIRRIVSQDQQGIGVRVGFSDLMDPEFSTRIEAVGAALGVGLEEVDLLVDLGAPLNFEPYDAFAQALGAAFQTSPCMLRLRNVTLISTGMLPMIPKLGDKTTAFPRHEWHFYRALSRRLPDEFRGVNFGDHTIVHPDFKADVDPRMYKPAGKLVYATSSSWLIRKGVAFRANPEQMHSHCQRIRDHEEFRGEAFSFGDQYIKDCAEKRAKPSDLTQWKKVGINHHMMVVLTDLANFHGSP